MNSGTVENPIQTRSSEYPAPPPKAAQVRPTEEPDLLAVFTLVLWLTCLAVGCLGWWLQRPTTTPKPKEPPQSVTELVEVQLPPEETAPQEIPPPTPQQAEQPEQPPDAPPPAPPPLPAVALPSPAIAFAIPVEGPSRIVSARQAVPIATPVVPRPVVRRLATGEGGGSQPDPQYPPQSIIDEEQGSVVIRFAVDESGRVISAEISSPCRWALLNQAALQTVRERYRFSPGALSPGLYEKRFVFRLNSM